MKVCARAGCPALTAETYCAAHKRAARATRETDRPSSSARGYDATHQRERKREDRRVRTRTVRCASGPTCKRAVDGLAALIDPDEPWDLGHNEERTGWIGAQHPECNRATKVAV